MTRRLWKLKGKMKPSTTDSWVQTKMAVRVTSYQRFLTTRCQMTKYKIHEATLSLVVVEEDFEMQSKTSESVINKYSIERPIMNILSGENVCSKGRYPDNRRKSHCLNSMDVISNQIRRVLQVQKKAVNLQVKLLQQSYPAYESIWFPFSQAREVRTTKNEKYEGEGVGGQGKKKCNKRSII